ncbi:OB-fold protein [Klebsiella michiganensis]|uniref:OB-fold protein n=1 Tax=Klebsiella michiganensis TaxID=1134687 RepID=UPI003D9FE298
MKKMMILCAVISLPAFSAETMPFNDAEVLAYLKPSSEDFFANAVAVLVKNDAEASLQQNKTERGTKLIPITVKTIANDFENNEITAIEKYKNKPIRINGIIKKIGLDALGHGVVTVSGGSSFSGNLVASVNKESNWVREASKGDKIDLTCNISGYVMLNVAATCEDSLTYTQRLIKKEYGVEEAFHLPTKQSDASLTYIIKANENEIAKSCSKPDDKCFKTVMDAMEKTKKPDPRFVAWANKLPE